jgi:oxalate decarboxylase/phosphoglucose isomerase-like protein (cupin superfamily)
VFTGPGQHEESLLGPGDIGCAPISSGHYIRNPTQETAFLILMYDDGEFSSIDLPWVIGNVPPQVKF